MIEELTTIVFATIFVVVVIRQTISIYRNARDKEK